MTDAFDQVAAPVHDYLLALAESVYQAQEQLALRSIVVQAGQPSVSYQLPRVDFELKMSFSLDQTDQEGPSSRLLRIRPISGLQDGDRIHAEVASSLKGSFVAVPAQGGRPPPLLTTTITRRSSTMFEVRARASTAAGEVLAGVEVQFNVDRKLSKALQGLSGPPEDAIAVDTFIQHGVVPTDVRGEAVTTLFIGEGQPKGSFVVVLVDMLGQTETLSFRVEDVK